MNHDTMKGLNILTVCFSLILVSIGCKPAKMIKHDVALSPVSKIVHVSKDSTVREIADTISINQIVSIIEGAKRSPAKFIVKETLYIYKADGSVMRIGRNEHFLVRKGITYTLTKRKSRKLSKLLENFE